MNNIKKKVTTILSIFSFCFVSSQNLTKDSITIQKHLKEVTKEHKKASIITINDNVKVDFISKYIIARKQESKQKEDNLKVKYDAALGRKYKNGDKSTIPKIISILKSKDKEKIATLLNEMELNYEERNKKLFIDETVKSEIFKLIYNNEFEPLIVQFLGYNNVEGHIDLFEQRLLSGQSKDLDRIFFWLGSDGTSEKSVDYLVRYYNGEKSFDNLSWITDGLNYFLEKGSKNTKQKIVDLSYDYINENPLKKEDFDEPTLEYLLSNFNFKLYFINIILKYGDERTKKFIENTEKLIYSEFKEIPNKEDLLFELKKVAPNFYSSAEKIKAIKELLLNRDKFDEIVNKIQEDKVLSSDLELIDTVFKIFEKHSLTSRYEVEKFLNHFSKIELQEFERIINKNISSKKLRQSLLNTFLVLKESLEEKNKYLFDIKLIEEPISKEQIQVFKNKMEYDDEVDSNSIFTSLGSAKIYFTFDTEPSLIPIDYDVLLESFSKITKGKITGIESYVQTKWNKSSEVVSYHFFVVYKTKCYIMIPEDLGDWYDMESFNNLLNLIVKDTNIKEEFVSLNTGDQSAAYIFGEKEKVNQLITKYHLKDDSFEAENNEK
jgi:hypothetical protein